ncbi:unnamed protein product [Parascedosporium putredinis]|uniref:SNF2 N-terminal domain-containing protein n=1 Tax=Parascedosporium putredinis TaxID=1442378 RepID=A0A9P1H4L2_9PEZI|nr:unnamed protein product [Parascedosporium putredinis]CAI7996781.1 unnamed protein product [Parascedosporium putredinis]
MLLVDRLLGQVGDVGGDDWSRTCRIFLIPNPQAPPSAGIKFYGIKVYLRLWQANDILRLMLFKHHAVHGDASSPMIGRGGFMAHDMGLGKTYMTLALCALRHAILKSKEDVTRAWNGSLDERHLPPTTPRGGGGNHVCPSSNPLGIQCYCVPGGDTRELASTCLVDGPALIIAPSIASAAPQWEKAAGELLDESALAVHIIASGRTETVQSLQLRQAAVRYEPKILPKTVIAKRATPDDLASFSYIPAPGQSNIVCIAALSALRSSMDRLGTCSVDVPIEGKANSARVDFEHCVAPGLVAYDEWHRERTPTTKVMKLLSFWMEHVNTGPCPPLLVFISGTPMPTEPSNLASPIALLSMWRHVSEGAPVLDAEEGWMTRNLQDMQRGFAALKPGDPRAEFIEKSVSFLSQVMVRRSVLGTFRGAALIRIPQSESSFIRCRMPAGLHARLTHLIATFQRDVSQANVPENRFWTMARTNAAFSLMILSAHLPGLLDLDPEELDRFFDIVKQGPQSWSRQGTPENRYLRSQFHRLAASSTKLAEMGRLIRQAMATRGAATRGAAGTGHVLVLSVRPIVAYLAYLWCEENIPQVQGSLILSNLSWKARMRQVARLGEESASTVVVFSTTGIMGTAVDGLQAASYYIQLGLTWTAAEQMQCEMRVRRSGQRSVSRCFILYSEDNPAEYTIKLRHEHRSVLVESAWFRGDGGREDQEEDERGDGGQGQSGDVREDQSRVGRDGDADADGDAQGRERQGWTQRRGNRNRDGGGHLWAHAEI